jgi:hypothetical protein
VRLTAITVKNKHVMNHSYKPQTWTDSSDKRPKRRNMEMRFSSWNIRNCYKAGSLVAVSKRTFNISWMQCECRRSYGRAVTHSQQESTCFIIEREMRTMNYVQFFCT